MDPVQGFMTDQAVIERVLNEGSDFLDAFVVQEQLVIYFNQQPDRLDVAIPRLWQSSCLTR